MNYKNLLKIVIGLCVVAAAVMFVIARRNSAYAVVNLAYEKDETEETGEAAETLITVATQAESLVVHVCGAVVNPGVYEVPAGSRIWDCIEMAGGFSEEASRTSLNLAEPVSDGEKILVPTEGEAAQLSLAAEQAAKGLVNINTATAEELMTLPGIGQARAEAIIAYRTSHGDFSQPSDIMNVSGIKESSYEKIKDKIITIDSG